MIDYKKSKAPITTVTRNIADMEEKSGNLYKAIVIASRRANQISVEIKDELNRKLEEFANYSDNLEEVFENREQIEISRFYERMPKATLIALEEFDEDQIYVRTPDEE